MRMHTFHVTFAFFHIDEINRSEFPTTKKCKQNHLSGILSTENCKIDQKIEIEQNFDDFVVYSNESSVFKYSWTFEFLMKRI